LKSECSFTVAAALFSMLKGISKLISPELIKILMEMGHTDEVVLGDANFPAASHAQRLVRADGHGIAPLLDAMLPLFPLDYAEDYAAVLMDYRGRLAEEPQAWADYRAALARWPDGCKRFAVFPKPEFYARAARAHAVVATGETSGFANIILRKGVVGA
jgi:L-fucose mutarotase